MLNKRLTIWIMQLPLQHQLGYFKERPEYCIFKTQKNNTGKMKLSLNPGWPNVNIRILIIGCLEIAEVVKVLQSTLYKC